MILTTLHLPTFIKKEERIRPMYNIIPTPRLSARIGGVGRVPLNLHLNEENFDGAKNAVRTFIDYADRVFSVIFRSTTQTGEGVLTLEKDETLPDGGYALIASPDGTVKIAAKDEKGLSYGFASLLLAAEKGEEGVSLPIMHICDEPQSNWRGLMIDLARKWHPISYLYDVVDLCYLYKINILHLHFCDNQSYTLPCDSLPKISTENRHYTKAELAAFVEYAEHRSITLIPEIDMPGHCACFTTKYPEIFGMKKGVVCAEEKTFAALETLIDEVMALFPNLPYIHLGGDEANLGAWPCCPGCVDYMKEHGIENVHELYAHFLARVTNYVLEKGKTPIIWEGFSKEYNHMISKKVIVGEFESYYQLPDELLEAGFRVLNCSWRPLYIVPYERYWTPAEILDFTIFTWRGVSPKSPAYETPIVVPSDSNVPGAQLCVWGDLMVPQPSNEEAVKEEFSLIRPRLAALAEKTWSLFSSLSAEDFETMYAHTDSVLQKMLRR